MEDLAYLGIQKVEAPSWTFCSPLYPHSVEGSARWELCIAMTRVTGQREATGLFRCKSESQLGGGGTCLNPSTLEVEAEAEAGGSLCLRPA